MDYPQNVSEYVRQHSIRQLMREQLGSLLRDAPEDPFAYIMQWAQRKQMEVTATHQGGGTVTNTSGGSSTENSQQSSQQWKKHKEQQRERSRGTQVHATKKKTGEGGAIWLSREEYEKAQLVGGTSTSMMMGNSAEEFQGGEKDHQHQQQEGMVLTATTTTTSKAPSSFHHCNPNLPTSSSVGSFLSPPQAAVRHNSMSSLSPFLDQTEPFLNKIQHLSPLPRDGFGSPQPEWYSRNAMNLLKLDGEELESEEDVSDNENSNEPPDNYLSPENTISQLELDRKGGAGGSRSKLKPSTSSTSITLHQHHHSSGSWSLSPALQRRMSDDGSSSQTSGKSPFGSVTSLRRNTSGGGSSSTPSSGQQTPFTGGMGGLFSPSERRATVPYVEIESSHPDRKSPNFPSLIRNHRRVSVQRGGGQGRDEEGRKNPQLLPPSSIVNDDPFFVATTTTTTTASGGSTEYEDHNNKKSTTGSNNAFGGGAVASGCAVSNFVGNIFFPNVKTEPIFTGGEAIPPLPLKMPNYLLNSATTPPIHHVFEHMQPQSLTRFRARRRSDGANVSVKVIRLHSVASNTQQQPLQTQGGGRKPKTGNIIVDGGVVPSENISSSNINPPSSGSTFTPYEINELLREIYAIINISCRQTNLVATIDAILDTKSMQLFVVQEDVEAVIRDHLMQMMSQQQHQQKTTAKSSSSGSSPPPHLLESTPLTDAEHLTDFKSQTSPENLSSMVSTPGSQIIGALPESSATPQPQQDSKSSSSFSSFSPPPKLQSLQEYVQQNGYLSVPQLQRSLLQVIDALHHSHFQSQPHLNVSSRNIFVVPGGVLCSATPAAVGGTTPEKKGSCSTSSSYYLFDVKLGMYAIQSNSFFADVEEGLQSDILEAGRTFLLELMDPLGPPLPELLRSVLQRMNASDPAQRISTTSILALLSGGNISNVLEETGVAIAQTDKHGLITSWNSRSEELFGYTKLEMVGKQNITVLMAGPKKEEDRDEKEEGVFSSEKKHEMLMEKYHADQRKQAGGEGGGARICSCQHQCGATLSVEMCVEEARIPTTSTSYTSAVPNMGGKFTTPIRKDQNAAETNIEGEEEGNSIFTAIFRDVSPRISFRALHSLVDAKTYISSTIPVAWCGLTKNGAITSFSHSASTLFQYRPGEVVGKGGNMLLGVMVDGQGGRKEEGNEEECHSFEVMSKGQHEEFIGSFLHRFIKEVKYRARHQQQVWSSSNLSSRKPSNPPAPSSSSSLAKQSPQSGEIFPSKRGSWVQFLKPPSGGGGGGESPPGESGIIEGIMEHPGSAIPSPPVTKKASAQKQQPLQPKMRKNSLEDLASETQPQEKLPSQRRSSGPHEFNTSWCNSEHSTATSGSSQTPQESPANPSHIVPTFPPAIAITTTAVPMTAIAGDNKTTTTGGQQYPAVYGSSSSNSKKAVASSRDTSVVDLCAPSAASPYSSSFENFIAKTTTPFTMDFSQRLLCVDRSGNVFAVRAFYATTRAFFTQCLHHYLISKRHDPEIDEQGNPISLGETLASMPPALYAYFIPEQSSVFVPSTTFLSERRMDDTATEETKKHDNGEEENKKNQEAHQEQQPLSFAECSLQSAAQIHALLDRNDKNNIGTIIMNEYAQITEISDLVCQVFGYAGGGVPGKENILQEGQVGGGGEMGKQQKEQQQLQKEEGSRSSPIIGENIRIIMPDEIAEIHQQFVERFKRYGTSAFVGTGTIRRYPCKHQSGGMFHANVLLQSFYLEERLYVLGLLWNFGDSMDITTSTNFVAKAWRGFFEGEDRDGKETKFSKSFPPTPKGQFVPSLMPASRKTTRGYQHDQHYGSGCPSGFRPHEVQESACTFFQNKVSSTTTNTATTRQHRDPTSLLHPPPGGVPIDTPTTIATTSSVQSTSISPYQEGINSSMHGSSSENTASISPLQNQIQPPAHSSSSLSDHLYPPSAAVLADSKPQTFTTRGQSPPHLSTSQMFQLEAPNTFTSSSPSAGVNIAVTPLRHGSALSHFSSQFSSFAATTHHHQLQQQTASAGQQSKRASQTHLPGAPSSDATTVQYLSEQHRAVSYTYLPMLQRRGEEKLTYASTGETSGVVVTSPGQQQPPKAGGNTASEEKMKGSLNPPTNLSETQPPSLASSVITAQRESSSEGSQPPSLATSK